MRAGIVSRGVRLLVVLIALASPTLAELVAENAAGDAVHSDGVDPTQASPVQREQAQKRFEAAKKLYDQGAIAEALSEFDASRAIVGSPNARLYRARCMRKLGRIVEAYTEFGRTMVEAMELAKLESRYTRTVEAATQERKALEAELAFVNVTVLHPHPETKLFVNGEEIRRTAWGQATPTAPGNVGVELKTPGLSGQAREITLQAGGRSDLTFDVQSETQVGPAPRLGTDAWDESAPAANRAAESKKSLRPYAYAAMGVGAAGLGAFTVLGILSLNQHKELERDCPDGRCPPGTQARIDRGKSQQLWANVGLIVGAVGVATGVTLFVLEPSADDPGPSVALSVSPSFVTLEGTL